MERPMHERCWGKQIMYSVHCNASACSAAVDIAFGCYRSCSDCRKPAVASAGSCTQSSAPRYAPAREFSQTVQQTAISFICLPFWKLPGRSFARVWHPTVRIPDQLACETSNRQRPARRSEHSNTFYLQSCATGLDSGLDRSLCPEVGNTKLHIALAFATRDTVDESQCTRTSLFL